MNTRILSMKASGGAEMDVELAEDIALVDLLFALNALLLEKQMLLPGQLITALYDARGQRLDETQCLKTLGVWRGEVLRYETNAK